MKIGIITFHASFNYGSMLQAWALQTYLHNLGHEVEIINYRSVFQKSIYYHPFDFHSKYSIESSFKRLLLYPSSIHGLYKKWNLFNSFLHENLKIGLEYNIIDELRYVKWDYDLVICGSDQIWNTNAPDSGEVYYGNFLPLDIKKISYAASFGEYPERINLDFLRKQLLNFSSISVREEKSKDLLLKNGLAKDVTVTCDPTLLLNPSDYLSIINEKSVIDDDYIFFYTPVGLPIDYFRIADCLGERLGLRIITERAYYPKDIKQFKHIENHIPTGPKEFLNLVRNATIVIGGSFHLQVFSILFRKNFYCINGDRDSRTNNLLSKLGLVDRIISLSNPNSFITDNIVEWVTIFDKLYAYRDKSIKYLKDNLDK